MTRTTLRYAFMASPSEPDGWSIYFPDLPGCHGWALTWGEIGYEAYAVASIWLDSERERGHPIPEPTTTEPDNPWPHGTKVAP